jgi:hypothetical protein
MQVNAVATPKPQGRNTWSLARIDLLAEYLLIVAVAFVANFLLFPRFGLYEDDYFFFGPLLDWSWSQWLHQLKAALTLFDNGRMNELAGYVLAYPAYRLGGLHAMYVVAFGLIAASSALFYKLLDLVSPRPLPLLGALAFALFPAHTNREHLNYALCVHPSVIFLLLACICFVTGLRKRGGRRPAFLLLSYLLIIGSLLTYENMFLPFLAVPLLAGKWDRTLLKRWSLHLLICALIIVGIFRFRQEIHETRTQEAVADLRSLPRTVLLGSAIGIGTSAMEYLERPREMLKAHHHGIRITILSSVVLLMAFFTWQIASRFWPLLASQADADDSNDHRGAEPAITPAQIRKSALRSAWKPLLAGVAMLLPAYMFSFTHFPPDVVSGRLTAMHVGAEPGEAMIVGTLCFLVFHLLASVRLKYLAAWILAVYFSLLIAFGVFVQTGFARSWSDERDFWTQVVNQCPDLNDGTVVLFDGYELPNTDYILVNSWADSMILSELFEFPANFVQKPKFITLGSDPGWRKLVEWKGRELEWANAPGLYFGVRGGEALPEGNVIILRDVNGRIIRTEQPLEINGRLFQPKKSTAARADFPHAPLYHNLIRANANPPK